MQPTWQWRQANFEGRIREGMVRSGFLVEHTPEDQSEVEQFERELWNLGLAVVEVHNPRCECPCHEYETAAYERDENGLAYFGCRSCSNDDVDRFYSREWPGHSDAQSDLVARAKADPTYAESIFIDGTEGDTDD